MAYSDRTYVGTGLGPGPEWITVYYVKPLHCNLCGNLNRSYIYRPQRSCGKVMFSQVFGILFTGVGHVGGWGVGIHGRGGVCGRGHAWQEGGMHGKGAGMARGQAWQGGRHGRVVCMVRGGICDRRDSHCSGRYASYWNAFMFCIVSVPVPVPVPFSHKFCLNKSLKIECNNNVCLVHMTKRALARLNIYVHFFRKPYQKYQ